MDIAKQNIWGITRVRNEAHIIRDTLDHVAQFCEKIVVYDDASDDDTAAICAAHPSVYTVQRGRTWAPDPGTRALMEGRGRMTPYAAAMKHADWIYCFDADEFAEIDFARIGDGDAYKLRLFDFYITPEDEGKEWHERRWVGPEYRDIPMLFRPRARQWRDRVPECQAVPHPIGYVRHYGKAISVEEWDKTCDYYVNHRWETVSPELQERWSQRRGKAIHEKSDFGRELITWEERDNMEKIVRI